EGRSKAPYSRRRRCRHRPSCPRGPPATRRRPRRAGPPGARVSGDPPCAKTLPMTKVMSFRKSGAHLGFAGGLAGERGEGDELVHDQVPVPLEALETAASEEEWFAANERPVPLVHLRRDDEVHLPVLVLEEHEDDAVRGVRALAGDDKPRDCNAAPVLEVLEVGARRHLGGQVWAQELERV